ncbi:dynein light chain roadblock-type 2 isoform X1 [Leopardus geoffroyi]|uniref:dynein light chain roadblock-type 2 isoform X1 n=1 Tax=Leopardus geoffroyi TaxID=46844 RepID=UPI001E25D910|nr:dynein light chain roadblock-type 2 isoform X1 [Leopardus geoffroyi]
MDERMTRPVPAERPQAHGPAGLGAPKWAPGATGPQPPPTAAGRRQRHFRAEEPPQAADRPADTQARAPALPGGHFLPRRLATSGSVAVFPGSGDAGLSRVSHDGKSGASVCDPALQAEVEETLKRIQSHKGVMGTMVVNAEGIPIRTTLDNSTTVQYAGLLHQLTMKAKSTVRDIDPQNDLTFLRIRSKKHEIMVAPDKEYLLIVIQNPCE